MTRTVVALFALASLAAGCAGILGIDELSQTDAGTADSGPAGTDGSHDAPGEDAGAPDVTPDSAPDVTADSAPDGPVLCPPRDAGTVTPAELEWARWPMPNSAVDVEAGAPNLESYTDNGDGTVTDNVTGLMWQKTVFNGAFTQSAAVAHCNSLNLAGTTDWQLPTYIELVSIVNLAQQMPAIDPVAFPGTPAEVYWSSTAAVATSSEWWDVSFIDGHTSRDSTTGNHHARCVRRPGVTVADAGASCTRYLATVGGSAIVTDTFTGLTWQYAPSNGNGNVWSGATSYCSQLTFRGLSGWRLPTGNELLTLVDVTQSGPALDSSAFSTMLDEYFWSSSPVAGSTTTAWGVNLGPGNRSSAATSVINGVRCVR